MDTSAIMGWAPYLALIIGFACGLSAARSSRTLVVLFLTALVVQVVGWTLFYLLAESAVDGWNETWQQTLATGFLAALMTTVPYTPIGTVVGAGVVGAARLRRSPARP